MEGNNYNPGDLTDIIRTGGGATPPEEWQFTARNPVNACTSESGRDDFGYPFTHFGDPLLDETETPAASGYFHSKHGLDESRYTVGFVSGAGDFNHYNIKNMMGQRINLEQEIKIPNYFSRTLQISPASWKIPAAPCGSPPGACHPQNRIISRNFPVESSAGLQIPSPRNTGVRRRKSQVKKVVCIPAPTPANSRPSGEIVPSDLWAWRKYGQKPIKGSPYPRSYYRCSSSRGCSARKQVERSRTDPNMLVIIYTSGHNHPWPTQRNSLAGSTRSQPSKTNGPKAISQAPQKETVVSQKTTSSASAAGTTTIQSVKEETDPDPLEMDDPEFDDGSFPNSYRPVFPGSNRADDSFFADLGEIEVDSPDIFWFSGGDGSGQKGTDRFSFCDGDGSSGDAKKDS